MHERMHLSFFWVQLWFQLCVVYTQAYYPQKVKLHLLWSWQQQA